MQISNPAAARTARTHALSPSAWMVDGPAHLAPPRGQRPMREQRLRARHQQTISLASSLLDSRAPSVNFQHLFSRLFKC